MNKKRPGLAHFLKKYDGNQKLKSQTHCEDESKAYPIQC